MREGITASREFRFPTGGVSVPAFVSEPAGQTWGLGNPG
jgi:hypothetical protein